MGILRWGIVGNGLRREYPILLDGEKTCQVSDARSTRSAGYATNFSTNA